MASNPLVSGIIIFLNGEQLLQEAIESVFAQTYEHWELLRLDDGSTDGALADPVAILTKEERNINRV